MGRHNEHTCLVCGKKIYYCRSCVIEPIKHLAEGFCSETCADIFAILSKHGCHLATAEETLKALKDYDLTGLNESIQAHIKSLQPKAEAKTDETKVESKKEVETTKRYSFKTQE